MAFLMTSGIAERVANDERFSRAVIRATRRFIKKDWGKKVLLSYNFRFHLSPRRIDHPI